jgi:phosphoribosylformimino-5-aminoimidazole carboxamide ribotide isomerase
MSLPRSVLPVIDLMNGQVVHARAGQRSLYRPLISQWCNQSHDPIILTNVLRQHFGISEYYLADLDALEGRTPQQGIIARLLETGVQLWLDAGIKSASKAEYWLSMGVDHVIIASETLTSLSLAHELFHSEFSSRLIFSLDLVAGRLRSPSEVFPSEEPLAVVEEIAGAGCRQFIILDTAAVGTSEGPTTLNLCRQVHERHPHCTIISGGGVRNRMDITQWKEAGVERVLVSTWLHQGCP